MAVFVTGGTGFVGSHLVEHLLKEGRQVIALVRPTSDIDHLSRLGVEMVEGSLAESERLANIICDADAVIHVAGMTGGADRETLYRVNVEGTRALVDTAARCCPEGMPFVYVSSVAAQGPSRGPSPRSLERVPEPVSDYGRTKLGGEGAVLAHRDHLGVTIVRPPAIYGPRDRDVYQVFALVNRNVAPVLDLGGRWLSIIHVEDVARAIVACLDAPGNGEIYPIDDGACYTWRELAEEIAAAMDKFAVTIPVPRMLFKGAAWLSEIGGRLVGRSPTFGRDKYREMIQESWVCGHREIHGDLGWKPKWDLARGAEQTARWYRDRGWL